MIRFEFPRRASTRPVAAALCAIVLVSGVWLVARPTAQAPSRGAATRHVPADLPNTLWLQRLAEAQTAASAGLAAFHDFRFTDRVANSGITFRHRIVDDAGKTYKAVHYDHGNGVAIADVDGDGLHDIYFVSQIGGNQLWRNAGGGRFEDITATAGVAMPGPVGVSASFADIDNDGDADLFVTTVRGGNRLFENDGSGRFRDISEAAGVNYSGHSSTGVFFDYDRDGRLDLFLVNVGRYTSDAIGGGDTTPFHIGYEDAFSGHLFPERAERSILYRNEGGNRFTDVSERVGLMDTSWSGDATAIDVNEDGWLDLYVLNMQGDDEYYENMGGTRFVRRSREVFPRTSWGAMGVKVFDVNNDGRLDLFITDMHSDMSANVGPEHAHEKSAMQWPESFRGDGSSSIWGNSLFVREAPGRFREASQVFNTETYWPWGPSVGDLNADGLDDVFITGGMNYPYRYGINSVKLNDGGRRFADAEFVLGVEPRNPVATPWFEIDASGADREHRDAAGAAGRLAIWAARGSRGAIIFDLDRDGDLDIVTSEFNATPMVLLSNLSERTEVHYLEVNPIGTKSNRNGLGAIVTVTAGGSSYTKVNDGNSGYLSHSLPPLYFGLGGAESVERIVVRWPSGAEQTVQPPIAINSRLDVREP